MSVILEGLASNLSDEERALAYLKVEHNGQTYDWQMFIPPGADLSAYIASKEASIYADIDAKEAASLPVVPDIPDYYAKRRAEYPSLAEQLGAMWKGGEAAAAMAAKIEEIKAKYPKP